MSKEIEERLQYVNSEIAKLISERDKLCLERLRKTGLQSVADHIDQRSKTIAKQYS